MLRLIYQLVGAAILTGTLQSNVRPYGISMTEEPEYRSADASGPTWDHGGGGPGGVRNFCWYRNRYYPLR